MKKMSLLLLLTSIVSCTGCQMFAAKRIFQEVRGGQPQLTVISDPHPTALLEYEKFTILPIENQMTPKLSSSVENILRQAFIREIIKEPRLFILTEKTKAPHTLVMNISIIHYQESKGLSTVLGGMSQLICRVELIDGPSGKLIGKANCAGYSKAIARSGLQELSEGTAKALRKWLTKQAEDE